MTKHLYHLTPVHHIFPSSDPTVTPPHAIFRDQQPHLSSSIPSQPINDTATSSQVSDTPVILNHIFLQ